MERQFIEGYEYNGLLDTIRYGIKKVDDAIDIYEFLKNKKTKVHGIDGDEIIENPHFGFLERLFNKSMSDFACGLKETDEEFLKSNYLSKELKQEIYSKLSKNCSKELTTLLRSEKQVTDFSKKEIKEILALFKTTANASTDKTEYGKLYYLFGEYLFILDGNGPIEYIKEKYGEELPIAMLNRSNVIVSASYYSGYGVDSRLLGDRHLFSLYKKFLKYYPDKADEFVKMVMSIKTLTPTEFITNYLSFVRNDLNNNFEKKNGNISLDDVHDSARDLVGAASLFSLISGSQSNLDKSFELDEQNSIKKEFIQKIEQFKNTQKKEQTKGAKILNKI